ncbi:MAG TPA: porin [Phnomibacter sp.]|nr:porin [Phnomibacter sp.]
MRKIFAVVLTLSIGTTLSAQTEKQFDTSKVYQPIISADRAKLLSNVDVIANMQFGFSNYFTDGKYDESKFALNQFRLEIKGKVHEKVYYRFRNRYTRAPDPQSQDNVNRSVDMAFIRIDATPKWNFTLGKMCADWGGYEFDFNPIEMYAYNDFIDNSDNFLTGVQAQFIASPQHTFTAQVLNSRTKTFEEIYDTIPGVVPAKFPAALVGNWRGNFGNGKFTTLWSYSNFLEAKGKSMFYLALGNKYTFKKGTLIYDFKWSHQDIDRTGIISGMVPDNIYPYAAENTEYVEHWLQLQYRFTPKWKASIVGMTSNAYWKSNPDNTPNKEDLLRTSYGIIPAVEFYPFKNLNLRFYATHIMRFYNYSDYAKNRAGYSNYSTGRFMLGFISPLLIL